MSTFYLIKLYLIIFSIACFIAQELSPTTNTNLAVSLMRMMEAQMEDFKDPAAIKAMDSREVVAWIEVRSHVACDAFVLV